MKTVTLKVDKFSTCFTSVIEGKDGVKTANSRYYLSFQGKREYLEATENIFLHRAMEYCRSELKYQIIKGLDG